MLILGSSKEYDQKMAEINDNERGTCTSVGIAVSAVARRGSIVSVFGEVVFKDVPHGL
jgi:hypothetical protein